MHQRPSGQHPFLIFIQSNRRQRPVQKEKRGKIKISEEKLFILFCNFKKKQDSAMLVVVQWLAELAQDQGVLGSILATSMHFAVLKFVRC